MPQHDEDTPPIGKLDAAARGARARRRGWVVACRRRTGRITRSIRSTSWVRATANRSGGLAVGARGDLANGRCSRGCRAFSARLPCAQILLASFALAVLRFLIIAWLAHRASSRCSSPRRCTRQLSARSTPLRSATSTSFSKAACSRAGRRFTAASLSGSAGLSAASRAGRCGNRPALPGRSLLRGRRCAGARGSHVRARSAA